ncbi:MAG: lipoprotein-releasing system permease protein [Paraglaciecola psychrophila]|jgi:lipoprotein-releasing system permease protein
MYRPLSLFIGLRYTRAKRRNQFISFVSLISLLGMVLGVIALVVVLSVMNGFEGELRNRILAVVPHGFIDGPDQRLSQWRGLRTQLEADSQVLASAPYIDSNVMLSRPGIVRGVQLHAIEPLLESKVSSVHQHMISGQLSDLSAGANHIVLGEILARIMGVYVGDEITVILPRVMVSLAGLHPRQKRYRVSGIFQVGADLDSNTAFIHLADGQKLFQLGDSVEGLRLQFQDLFSAADELQRLLPTLPAGLQARDWAQTQGSLFQAVKMEKTMVSLLLMVIVTIAAFNIVSILTMMVADKRADIAVLRTMGASQRSVIAVFMIQGISVGLAGIVLGIVIGVPIALQVGDIVYWLENALGGKVFNPNVYFISRIPSLLETADLVLIASSGFVLSALATIYPALRAAKIQPAEALRYE